MGQASAHYLNKKRTLEAFRIQEKNSNVLRWIDEAIESLDWRIGQERIAEEREF